MIDFESVQEQLVKYYQDLLIIQYRQSETNRATIKAMADLIDANMLILQLRDGCLNVEKSVGVQLDVVGEWLGIDRHYDNSVFFDKAYFADLNWNTSARLDQGEYQTIDGSTTPGIFMDFEEYQQVIGSNYKLPDEKFRKLIKLKILYNNIRFVRKEIDDAIWEWSEHHCYTVWNKMSLKYCYDAEFERYMLLANYKGILPCPVGVEMTLEKV